MRLRRLLNQIQEIEGVEQFVDEDFAHMVQARIEEIDADLEEGNEEE